METVLKEAKKIISLGNGDWKTGSESGTVYNGKAPYRISNQILLILTFNSIPFSRNVIYQIQATMF